MSSSMRGKSRPSRRAGSCRPGSRTRRRCVCSRRTAAHRRSDFRFFQQWADQGAPEGDTRDPAGGSRVRVHVAPRRTRPRRLDAGGVRCAADGKDGGSETSCCACRLRRSASFKPLNFSGESRVVHHARILVDETDASRWRDSQDPGPGFGGMDAPEAHFPDGHFLGWAPGKLASRESLSWPITPERTSSFKCTCGRRGKRTFAGIGRPLFPQTSRRRERR